MCMNQYLDPRNGKAPLIRYSIGRQDSILFILARRVKKPQNCCMITLPLCAATYEICKFGTVKVPFLILGTLCEVKFAASVTV